MSCSIFKKTVASRDGVSPSYCELVEIHVLKIAALEQLGVFSYVLAQSLSCLLMPVYKENAAMFRFAKFEDIPDDIVHRGHEITRTA